MININEHPWIHAPGRNLANTCSIVSNEIPFCLVQPTCSYGFSPWREKSASIKIDDFHSSIAMTYISAANKLHNLLHRTHDPIQNHAKFRPHLAAVRQFHCNALVMFVALLCRWSLRLPGAPMTPLEVSEVLPSGNETWFAGKYGKVTIEINDFPS